MNASQILVLLIRSYFVKFNTHYVDFVGTDWSAQQSYGDPFTNNKQWVLHSHHHDRFALTSTQSVSASRLWPV